MAPRAAQTALEIMENLTGFNTERAARNEPTLDLSIGLHIGPLVAGNIGSDRSYGYSVIGGSVDIAKTLACHAVPGQILASSALIQMAGDRITSKELPSFSAEETGGLVPYEIVPKEQGRT
jgi:adenylate cyclase